jgi:hypothetical protein
VSYKKQELLTLLEHPCFFYGVRVEHLFSFCVLSYCVSLRSGFRVVMSLTISGYKRCSIRLYLQLFVGGLMSYLRYLCLFAYSDVQQILCCVFALFLFVLCPHVTSLSSVSIFDCPFGTCLRILVLSKYCVVFLFCFCSSCVPMLPVYLECPFLIAPSVSLTFIYPHIISKGRSPYNGRLSDFSFYIDSQISVHRKFKK